MSDVEECAVVETAVSRYDVSLGYEKLVTKMAS